MGPYLDQDIERELGLEFIPEEQFTTHRQELNDKIDGAVDSLGDRTDLLEIPRSGFLRQSLTHTALPNQQYPCAAVCGDQCR